MQAMKESASNISASAKAGMEKTKATMQEKVEKMSSHDPAQKEMAREMKEDRMARAELNKQEAKGHNAAARQAASATGGQGRYTTSGTGAYQSSETESQIYSATGANNQQYSGVAELGGLCTQPSGLPVGDGTGYGSGTRGNAPACPDDSTFN